jgi:hypothetical protein
VVYAALVVGQLSHWIEYDADLAAILDTDGQVNPDYARDLIYTLAVLQGPQRESRLAHWLHPPTSARIAWIRRVLMQPEEGMGFRRKLDLLARVIYGLVVALAVIVLLAPMFALGPQ